MIFSFLLPFVCLIDVLLHLLSFLLAGLLFSVIIQCLYFNIYIFHLSQVNVACDNLLFSFLIQFNFKLINLIIRMFWNLSIKNLLEHAEITRNDMINNANRLSKTMCVCTLVNLFTHVSSCLSLPIYFTKCIYLLSTNFHIQFIINIDWFFLFFLL